MPLPAGALLLLIVADKRGSLGAFVEVAKVCLVHDEIRLCALGRLSILKQHFGCKASGAISADASDNVAACEACGKYLSLCHSEISHETSNGKSLSGRFLFFGLEIA